MLLHWKTEKLQKRHSFYRLLPTCTDFYRLLPTFTWNTSWVSSVMQCSFEHASQGQTATWRWLRSRASWFARGGLWWPVARFGRRCNVVGMNYSSATFTDHRSMMFIKILYVYASGVENRASSRARVWKHAYAPSRLGLGVCVCVCVNVHVNLLHMHMLRHVCFFFNVHVNLLHMHMLRYVWGSGGFLTFMLSCCTCTCYVTSGVRGCVNIHFNLLNMRMLRHVWGSGVCWPSC